MRIRGRGNRHPSLPKWARDGGAGSVVYVDAMESNCDMCQKDIHWWPMIDPACMCHCPCEETWQEHLKH